MTNVTWEKAVATDEAQSDVRKAGAGINIKFWAAGLLILGAAAYLLISGTISGARYFITVTELLNDSKYVGQTVRISGAVIGDTIRVNPEAATIDFVIADIPAETPDLARVLYEAANNPNAKKLAIHIDNQPKPDLLEHEAQAILTGKLGEDGVFYATEVLLKCPSRYGEAKPEDAITQPEQPALNK
jgi:cytochrome c-type biogenesis protein CcmE